MPLSESANAQAFREFEDVACPICHERKRERQSFCEKCYFSLPREMRNNLYHRFGSGYEEAYWEARDYLNEERETKKKGK